MRAWGSGLGVWGIEFWRGFRFEGLRGLMAYGSAVQLLGWRSSKSRGFRLKGLGLGVNLREFRENDEHYRRDQRNHTIHHKGATMELS